MTTGKRMAEMLLMGRSPGAEAEQLEQRNARDIQDGITRITDDTGVAPGKWLVLIHGVKQDPLDVHYLDAHTAAANKGFKLGRLDYIREWKTCARWLIFRSPRMAIIDKEGVRFLEHHHVAHLNGLLESGTWKDVPVWSGRLAPGGSL